MIDFKKTQKDLYQPATTASIVNVPSMKFAVVSGKGDPNALDGEFQSATELLYGLSYAIKMNNKDKQEYVVPPLEGLWRSGEDVREKSKYDWTLMIRQPDFVTDEIFEEAKAATVKKKKHLDVSKARLESFEEGLCVQVMHVGGYDNEPATIEAMIKTANGSGYVIDIDEKKENTLSRRHHEVYLSNPQKTKMSELKTILRYPVKKK